MHLHPGFRPHSILVPKKQTRKKKHIKDSHNHMHTHPPQTNEGRVVVSGTELRASQYCTFSASLCYCLNWSQKAFKTLPSPNLRKLPRQKLNSKDVLWLQPRLAFIAFVCVKNVFVIWNEDAGTPTWSVTNVPVFPSARLSYFLGLFLLTLVCFLQDWKLYSWWYIYIYWIYIEYIYILNCGLGEK